MTKDEVRKRCEEVALECCEHEDIAQNIQALEAFAREMMVEGMKIVKAEAKKREGNCMTAMRSVWPIDYEIKEWRARQEQLFHLADWIDTTIHELQ